MSIEAIPMDDDYPCTRCGAPAGGPDGWCFRDTGVLCSACAPAHPGYASAARRRAAPVQTRSFTIGDLDRTLRGREREDRIDDGAEAS